MSFMGPVDPVGGFWNPDSTSLQVVGSAFPSSPSEGQQFFDTAVDWVYWWNGSAWVVGLNLGAWISYTPTLGNITLGNGSLDCRYMRSGRKVTYINKLTFGSTTSVSGSMLLQLPPIAPDAWYTVNTPLGDVVGLDQGIAVYHGRAIATGNTLSNREYHPTNQASPAAGYNGTTPFTWANTDQLFTMGWYLAAASA